MKKAHLKTGLREVTNYIDMETGELLDVKVKNHKFLTNDKGLFFMGYSALIGVFMEMSQAEIRIFGYCLRYAKGVKFDISKRLRLDMAKTININERTILNTIPSLEDKGVLYRHENGLFQINPRFAFEGGRDERNNALKAIIELGCKHC